MKECQIYKTKSNFIIVTYSKSSTGLYISDDPIYVIPLAVVLNELQQLIFDSLMKSRIGVKQPLRNELYIWQKEQLVKMQQKSYSTLYKSSNSCILNLENNILKIYPQHYNSKNKSKTYIKEDVVVYDYNEDKQYEITLKIMEILERNYTI